MGKGKPIVTVSVTAVLGAMAGFLVLHPYSAIVYGLYEKDSADPLERLISTFTPETLLQCIPFSIAGGFGGLFLGLWLVVHVRKEEYERSAFALSATRGLIVTMAHYLVNSSTTIGIQASRLEKMLDDEDLRKRTSMIRREAVSIEAVVNAIRKLETIEMERYSNNSEAMMLDIRNSLEEELGRHGASGHDVEHAPGASPAPKDRV